MVERFHRQLKAALMCHPDSSWLQALPVVLLGIRSAIKEELNASPAELVYGEPLRLPGELISSPPADDCPTDPTTFSDRLRHIMAKLRPVPASHHTNAGTFVFKDLHKCTHVLLRDDTVRGSLKPPYTGPHRVLHRDDKTVTILQGNKETKVSIDRVKPAYLLSESPPVNSPADYTTRSGRRVRFRL